MAEFSLTIVLFLSLSPLKLLSLPLAHLLLFLQGREVLLETLGYDSVERFLSFTSYIWMEPMNALTQRSLPPRNNRVLYSRYKCFVLPALYICIQVSMNNKRFFS